ncbi:MAG: class I SAM-dependent methyltransferase [Lachnospiraceae bacterium]|nr:class I SAM-dependent methyltransferase [Lachnospiraceae bacterium]
MRDYSVQNKKAWEYSAYNFWVEHEGMPEKRAKKDLEDPKRMLRKFAKYFDSFENVKIANICGSCGKKAVPLAILGADVTVFDISEDNRRYATETAKAAGVPLNYEVCDIIEIDLDKYAGYFDIAFMEGGILHYFHDIDEFMKMMYAILKPGGKIICSDFHPFTKINDSLKLGLPSISYFSTDILEIEMAHARFYEDEIRKNMPKCKVRKYTVSEIINSMIRNGFVLKQFDEYPAWEDETLPGEFAAIGIKEKG